MGWGTMGPGTGLLANLLSTLPLVLAWYVLAPWEGPVSPIL